LNFHFQHVLDDKAEEFTRVNNKVRNFFGLISLEFNEFDVKTDLGINTITPEENPYQYVLKK